MARKFTFADYLAFPDDGKRYEIIDGALHVNGACSPRHQFVVTNIMCDLAAYARRRQCGAVLPGRICVRLDDEAVVEPDLIFIAREGAARIGAEYVSGAPDLIVEVVAEETRALDENAKLDVYERCGVREYWVVDPARGTVAIHRRMRDRFDRVETGGTITSPLLPNFALPIADVFA